MAETKAPATPFEKLAASLNSAGRVESRDGGQTEAFQIPRGHALIEFSLLHGSPTMLVLRGTEDEAPISDRKQNVLARVRKRLVYAPIAVRLVTALDRVNSMFALRFDVRTNDAAFDKAVVMEADLSDDVIAQTFGSKEARQAALEILNSGLTLRFEDRAICAELPSPTEAHFNAVNLGHVADNLAVMVANVPRVDASSLTKRPQAGRVITAAIVVIGILGTAALAPGTLDEPGAVIRPLPRPLLPLPFMLPGVLAGAAAFVLFYLGLRWQLKRRNMSTDLPLVLAVFVVLATLGVGGLDAANRLLDDADLAVQSVKITAKDTGTSRKSGNTNEWFLVVPSWRADAKELELSVNADLHRAVRVGDGLTVTVHPGFFGWEWGAVVERDSLAAPRSDEPLPPEKPRKRPKVGTGDKAPAGDADNIE
ncbi:MAG: hypothetical protein IPK82_13700 [Polyangiaceae bacterium]|nr:hypothetical protein [Polyangiaceae bacterium]